MSETDDAIRIRQLTEVDQPEWFAQVHQAVTAQAFDDLDHLASSDCHDFELLGGTTANMSTVDDEFAQHESADPLAGAAIAVVAVGRAVLDPRNRTSWLRDAVDLFASNGVVSVTDSADDDGMDVLSVGSSQLSPLVRAFDTVESEPSAPFVALLAAALVDRLPSERGAPVTIPVLFDPQVGADGIAGTLRLAALERGPSGLHPDPRRMAFARLDPAFRTALKSAWDSVPEDHRDVCVVWSLHHDESTILDVDGDSLGVAFAVGLDEIAPRSRLKRLLRRRTLDPTCAVTGRLHDDEILPVAGYTPKIRAAEKMSWRVVVPQQSMPEINEIAIRLRTDIDLRGAATLNEAIATMRSRVNRRLVLALALACAIVFGGTGGSIAVASYFGDQIQHERSQRIASELADRSVSLRKSDQRLAALTALASYEINPSAQGASALLGVSDSNPATIRTVQTQSGSVRSVVLSAHHIVTAGSDGHIDLWTRDLNRVGRAEIDHNAFSMDISRDESRLIVNTSEGLGTNAILFALSGDTLTETARWDSHGSKFIFSTSGNELIGIGGHGRVERRDLTGSSTGAQEVVSSFPASATGVQATVTDAAAVACFLVGLEPAGAGSVGDGSEGECVLLLSDDGSMYRVDLAGDDMTRIGSRADFPAMPTSLLVTTSGLVFVGTEKGAVRWVERRFRFTGEDADLVGGVDDRIFDMSVDGFGDIVLLTGHTLDPDTAVLVSHEDVSSVAAEMPAVSVADVVISDDQLAETPEHINVIGRSDGTISMIGTARNRLGLTTGPGSTVPEFTPDGDLVSTYSGGSPNFITQIQIHSTAGLAHDDWDLIDSYSLGNDEAWYINDIEVTKNLVFASGQRRGVGHIAVWDRRTGQLVHSLDTGSPGDSNRDIDIATFIAPSDDETRMASYNLSTGKIQIWAIDGTMSTRQIASYTAGGVGALGYSPHSAQFYSVSWKTSDPGLKDHELSLMDADTGELLETISVSDARRASANSADGSMILLHPRRIEVREPTSWEVTRTQNLPETAITVAWNPDGTRLAVLSQARRIYVLDGTTLTTMLPPLEPYDMDDDSFTGLAWSPDGTLIATNSLHKADNRVLLGDTYVFRVDAEAWADRMCDIAGSTLSTSEWSELVGDEIPYRRLCD